MFKKSPNDRSLPQIDPLGHYHQRQVVAEVRKCKPLKKIPETDRIFNEVHRLNDQTDVEGGVLRISLDTKATVKIGNYSRGGYSRQVQAACGHGFEPNEKLIPFGILLPRYGNFYSHCSGINDP